MEVLKDLLEIYGKLVDEEKARMIMGMSIEYSRHAIIKTMTFRSHLNNLSKK